uniref:Uncharacterized protein n=1 Tax=Arion vulgaris TaxID=1028688 RepID=A0A0B7AWG1_9EUPU
MFCLSINLLQLQPHLFHMPDNFQDPGSTKANKEEKESLKSEHMVFLSVI